MCGMQCLYNLESGVPAGDPIDVQTVRVMNRYWTEVVNLNIGKNKNYKMSQIVLELQSGTICVYPGGDI